MHVPAAVGTARRPAAVDPAHPSAVTAAYERLREVFPQVRIDEPGPGRELPTGDGWATAAELVAGGAAFEDLLADEEGRILRDYGSTPRPARPDVVAGFALHRYAWPACLLVTVPWFLHRRVPRLGVADISFRRDLGGLAARVTTFACLPDDPAARLPGAVVVRDEEALRAEARTAVADHLAPVLAVFGPRMRRRGRALWGLATDEIVEGLWYVGHLLGEEQRAMAELRLLLPGATAPYVGAAAFRELTGPDGAALPTRDRASCCMFFTLRPEDTCLTCPRTCDADRVARLGAAPSAD